MYKLHKALSIYNLSWSCTQVLSTTLHHRSQVWNEWMWHIISPFIRPCATSSFNNLCHPPWRASANQRAPHVQWTDLSANQSAPTVHALPLMSAGELRKPRVICETWVNQHGNLHHGEWLIDFRPKYANHDTHNLYRMFFPNSPDMHPHTLPHSRWLLRNQ